MISGLLEFRSKLDRKKQMDLDRGGFLVSYLHQNLDCSAVLINTRYSQLEDMWA